jgi:hypothetical protein
MYKCKDVLLPSRRVLPSRHQKRERTQYCKEDSPGQPAKALPTRRWERDMKGNCSEGSTSCPKDTDQKRKKEEKIFLLHFFALPRCLRFKDIVSDIAIFFFWISETKASCLVRWTRWRRIYTEIRKEKSVLHFFSSFDRSTKTGSNKVLIFS